MADHPVGAAAVKGALSNNRHALAGAAVGLLLGGWLIGPISAAVGGWVGWRLGKRVDAASSPGSP